MSSIQNEHAGAGEAMTDEEADDEVVCIPPPRKGLRPSFSKSFAPAIPSGEGSPQHIATQQMYATDAESAAVAAVIGFRNVGKSSLLNTLRHVATGADRRGLRMNHAWTSHARPTEGGREGGGTIVPSIDSIHPEHTGFYALDVPGFGLSASHDLLTGESSYLPENNEGAASLQSMMRDYGMMLDAAASARILVWDAPVLSTLLASGPGGLKASFAPSEEWDAAFTTLRSPMPGGERPIHVLTKMSTVTGASSEGPNVLRCVITALRTRFEIHENELFVIDNYTPDAHAYNPDTHKTAWEIMARVVEVSRHFSPSLYRRDAMTAFTRSLDREVRVTHATLPLDTARTMRVFFLNLTPYPMKLKTEELATGAGVYRDKPPSYVGPHDTAKWSMTCVYAGCHAGVQYGVRGGFDVMHSLDVSLEWSCPLVGRNVARGSVASNVGEDTREQCLALTSKLKIPGWSGGSSHPIAVFVLQSKNPVRGSPLCPWLEM